MTYPVILAAVFQCVFYSCGWQAKIVKTHEDCLRFIVNQGSVPNMEGAGKCYHIKDKEELDLYLTTLRELSRR